MGGSPGSPLDAFSPSPTVVDSPVLFHLPKRDDGCLRWSNEANHHVCAALVPWPCVDQVRFSGSRPSRAPMPEQFSISKNALHQPWLEGTPLFVSNVLPALLFPARLDTGKLGQNGADQTWHAPSHNNRRPPPLCELTWFWIFDCSSWVIERFADAPHILTPST